MQSNTRIYLKIKRNPICITSKLINGLLIKKPGFYITSEKVTVGWGITPTLCFTASFLLAYLPLELTYKPFDD